MLRRASCHLEEKLIRNVPGHQKIKVLSLCQSGFLWWPNIPRCINRIRIVQFIRFAPDLGRICTGPPHIHNLQAIHISLPSAFSAFSIPKPGSEGCWAAKRKIANYPCVYLCSILGTHPPCPPFSILSRGNCFTFQES